MQRLFAVYDRLRLISHRKIAILAVLLAVILLFYYPIGMLWIHKVDDNLDFKAETPPGASHSVAVTAALIDREVNRYHFTPNDPFFMPGAMLDRMPAFQEGVVYALSRFATELAEQLGRTRATSQMDADLDQAAGLLKYSPKVWIFDFSTSILPTASSEAQYRAARKALLRYNQRLEKGQAVFDRRADNLIETLNHIARDMGAASAALDAHIEQHRDTWFDTDADVLFYNIKGRMYAYYLVLRELKADFPDIIRERNLDGVWNQMLKTLGEGASTSHFFVFNADTNSQFRPNHLAAQGYALVNARTQIFEITNILMK